MRARSSRRRASQQSAEQPLRARTNMSGVGDMVMAMATAFTDCGGGFYVHCDDNILLLASCNDFISA